LALEPVDRASADKCGPVFMPLPPVAGLRATCASDWWDADWTRSKHHLFQQVLGEGASAISSAHK
jgi:hypothetical protein